VNRNLRLIVCGGRRYSDKAHVFDVLDHIHDKRNIVEIIEGGNRQTDERGNLLDLSADYFAAQWALSRGVKLKTMKAEWGRGRSAGPERNRKMALLAPDGVVAFPGGRGTENMKSTALKHGITVMDA
jgi:hypothetical protein